MPKSGTHNCLTDVVGLKVGHASSDRAKTGVTLVLCDRPLTAACDIRGGAPGSRETALLAQEHLVQEIDALVLSGGSVFGLAAADEVAARLSRDGRGLRLGKDSPVVPIVPAAIAYDLENDGDKQWGDKPPYRELGIAALEQASAPALIGRVGAGRGVQAGSVAGGTGCASIVLDEEVTVSALAVVNSVGSVLLPDGETFYAWSYELDGEFGHQKAPPAFDLSEPIPPFSRLAGARDAQAGKATTLAVVATTADLSRSELKRIAIMAHDGVARAIRPVHSPFDGDIVFALSGASAATPTTPIERAMLVARIGAAAGDCLARAICRGVYAARS